MKNLDEIILTEDLIVKIESVPFKLLKGTKIYGTFENFDLAMELKSEWEKTKDEPRIECPE